MQRRFISILAVGLLACPLLADPLSDDEQSLIHSQIPSRQTTLHPRMAELMGWAISQDEELVVLSGLQDVARLKITDLTDAVVKLLDDARPLVQTTAIQTLDALDARAAADGLLKLVQLKAPYLPRHLEQVQMADALLSRWGDMRGVPHWAARLADGQTPTPLRHSAARALAAGIDNNQAALKAMVDVINSEQERLPLRLLAAESLGSAVHANLEGMAQPLMARNMPGRLLAAQLLRHHSGGKALELLTRLANDGEPAVQAPAMQRLLETEPQRLWPTASQLITSPDPRVRLYTVKASLPWHDPQPVQLLGKALDDPHPEVRNEARLVLTALAKEQPLNGPVKNELRNWLQVAGTERKGLADYEAMDEPDYAPHWRAAEQAAILAGDLDDKPANPALLAMVATDVEHPRLEARIAAVDAIRKLHLPQSRAHITDLMNRLIDRMEARTNKFKEQQKADSAKAIAPNNQPDSRLAEITAQTLGVWDVEEADPILRRVLDNKWGPGGKHHPAHPRARASAIWALGYIHAGKGEEMLPLAKHLEERLYDQNPLDPEAHEVRLHSAITIARMKVASLTNSLRNRYENDGVEIQAAARWGIHHMTGEWLPALHFEPGQRSDGFIQPLD